MPSRLRRSVTAHVKRYASKDSGSTMIFDVKSCQLLESMRIDPKDYSNFLQDQHGEDAENFKRLIEQFSEFSLEEMSIIRFNDFINKYKVFDESLTFNQLYDLFNYLRLFREGDVFKLFKGRQAEWKGTQIKINESDVPAWDCRNLKEPIIIYRGMSNTEYSSGDFGQSWSLSQKVAQRFAKETYSDVIHGIAIKACINIESVIYYDPQDHEEEVIVKNASEFKVEII